MKTLFRILAAIFLISFPANAFAAVGTVTVTQDQIFLANGVQTQRVILLTCVGSVSGGDVPATTLSSAALNLGKLAGWRIIRFIVENDSGDTNVTDDSDIYLKDSGGTDHLLGQGVDALDDDTRNYVRLSW